MSITLVSAIFVFVAVGALAYAILSGAPRSRFLERRIASLRQPDSSTQDTQGVLRRSSSALPILRFLSSSGSLADRWALDLQRAGSNLKASEYFLLRLMVSVVSAALVLL